MIFKKIYILIIGLAQIISQSLIAQIPDPPRATVPGSTVSVIARSFGDSVMVRWAPNSIEAWTGGNTYGYNVFRYLVVDENTNVINRPIKEKLNQNPVRPLSFETIEKLYSHNSYAAIVAQAIYGNTFNLNDHSENVSLINQANDLSNRYSFSLFACDISLTAAYSHGLLFVDKEVKYGEKYVYCIKPDWNDTISISDSSLVFIAVNDTFPVPAPVDVYARFDNKITEISWEGKLMQDIFTAYHIERSDDQGMTFKRVNKNPVINTTSFKETKLNRIIYVDTVPEFEKEYYYRVRGVTPFGEISKPSEVVSGKGKKMLVGVNPMIIKSDRLPEGQIDVKWEFPAEYEKEITGFTVERSDAAEGIFARISDTLDAGIRNFRDKEPSGVNYYQVCAHSKSGYAYCSFPSLIQLPDSIPPAVPVGLEGTIDSSGTVRLKWFSNKEKDFKSYRIYRSNYPDEDFVLINSQMITKTSYVDTIPLNNLNNYIYYAISAQDKNYNESGKSVPLKIAKPDTISPVAPRISDYQAGPDRIRLEWIPSSSDDVEKHCMYRRDQGNDEWKLLAVFDTVEEINTYVDSGLVMGTTYAYLVIAVDAAGLESENNRSVSVRTGIATGLNPSVVLRLIPGADGKSVEIRWSFKDSEIGKVLIYKSVDEDGYVLFKTITDRSKKITDTIVEPGHTYSYRVQLITNSGVRMKISEPAAIKL